MRVALLVSGLLSLAVAERGCCWISGFGYAKWSFPAVQAKPHDASDGMLERSDCPDFIYTTKGGKVTATTEKQRKTNFAPNQSCSDFGWYEGPVEEVKMGCCYNAYFRDFKMAPKRFSQDLVSEEDCGKATGSPTFAAGKSCEEFDWYREFYGDQLGCCYGKKSVNNGDGWTQEWSLAGTPGSEDDGYMQSAKFCPVVQGNQGNVYFVEGERCQDIEAGRRIWPDQYAPTSEPTLSPTYLGLTKVCKEKKKCVCEASSDYAWDWDLFDSREGALFIAKAGYTTVDQIMADENKLQFGWVWNGEHSCTTKGWAKSQGKGTKAKDPAPGSALACYCVEINPPTQEPTASPTSTPTPPPVEDSCDVMTKAKYMQAVKGAGGNKKACKKAYGKFKDNKCGAVKNIKCKRIKSGDCCRFNGCSAGSGKKCAGKKAKLA